MTEELGFPSPHNDETLVRQHSRFVEHINDLLIPFQDAAYYCGCEVGKECADRELRRQRDELLGACVRAVQLWDTEEFIENSPWIANIIRDAIAKIKETP